MNIVTKTYSGHILVRPDTTWEKDSEDFYPPESVDTLSYSPVLFARISKPGRSVAARFASRYYDGIGFGVLLYPDEMMDGTPEGFAQASCLDHTSFLPFPVFKALTLEGKDNRFVLSKDGKEIFSCGTKGRNEESSFLNMIERAVEEASRMVYLRTGDLISIELAARSILVSRQDAPGKTGIEASWCGETTLDFKIVF